MPEVLFDIGTLRGLGTALIFSAFIGLLIWTFSNRRNAAFAEASRLPFADEPQMGGQDLSVSRSNQQ